MKILSYILIVLLVGTIGIVAFFYFNIFTPMAADYARIQEVIPSLERAKTELKRYHDRDIKETAWINPAVDILSSGLRDEISTGNAEVFSAGNRVVVNIAEDALYLPASSTFGKDSDRLRLTLATLLRKNELKGKEIYIGNMTSDVPPQRRGRKKISGKDARTLAGERSSFLIKDLEKNGVSKDVLIEAAYSAAHPEIGYKLKTRKTILIIDNPPIAPIVVKQQQPVQREHEEGQQQPTVIPIQPARPNAQ
jgi:hypothetical protein